MLFIGEPLTEYVATAASDGTLSSQTSIGFAGDVAPNMASYARMAATRFGSRCSIDVLTAVGPEGHAPSDDAMAELITRGLAIHPFSKRIAGRGLGTVINLKNTDGSQSQEKVRLDRCDSAFRDLLNDATDRDLAALAAGYTHIVVSGTSLACIRERAKLLAVLQEAKTNDPPPLIIVSTNLRSSNWQMPDREHPDGLAPNGPEWRPTARRWLNAAIQLADIVFANFTDERHLRGCTTLEEAGQALRRLSATAEIILTNDAAPIAVFHRDGDHRQCTTLAVPPPDRVVDTVGAGDAFAGTYVAARLVGRDPRGAAECALAIASQVVGFDGALPRHGTSLVFDATLFGAAPIPDPDPPAPDAQS